MKALVFTAPRRLEMQDLPVPEIGGGEALIRVRASGVCGSDLHGFLGKSKRRVPPLVLGHEFSGEVAEISSAIPGVSAGDRVAIYPLKTCGQCAWCRTGRENICPNRKVYGLDFHGGLAEYVSAPGECLFRIPSDMSFAEGSLVEPLANAIHVIDRCQDIEDRTILIYGAGPIGTFCYLVARARGAGRIAVIDRNARRLARLTEVGAESVIDASRQDAVSAALEWSGGSGADITVDAVGYPAVRNDAIACTASGGTVLCIGLADDVCDTDTRPVVVREIDLKGSYAYTKRDFAHAIQMLESGVVPWRALVSESPLEAGQSVFDDLASPESALMKAVFIP